MTKAIHEHPWETAQRRFNLGEIFVTPGVRDEIDPEDVGLALSRHVAGDWGELEDEDREENEVALREGFRLMSVYTSLGGVRFWIITEADRSATTALLPEEY